MLRRTRLQMNPTSWVYLLVHGVIVLLGYLLVMKKMEALGTSLIATGITGAVIFVYVYFTDTSRRRLRVMFEFGIISAFEARAARIKEEYDRRLVKVSHIDVLGFGLRALREDYKHEFQRWAATAHVRVLLIDPDYPSTGGSYAQQREREEGDTPGSIKADVEAFIKETVSLRAGPSPRFQIRLYRCLPAVNIFRADDEIFWGPYFVGSPSRNSPTFIVGSNGILYRRLLMQFESIWSDDELSRPV